MFSCENCDIFKDTYIKEYLRTTASKHRSNFLEVFCRSYCSTLINTVMKYSFSAPAGQSWRALHANLLKLALHHRYFSKNSPQVQNSDIEKYILMAASEDEFILETLLHGCFSKAAANIFILEILKAPEHEYIFSKYSRNLNISGIFWACYTKNNFPIIFPKYKKRHFLTSIEI